MPRPSAGWPRGSTWSRAPCRKSPTWATVEPDLVQQFLKRRAVALVLSDFAFEASGKAAAERRAEQAAQAAPGAGGTTPTASEPSIFEQREKAAAWGKIYDRAQDALSQRDI